MRSSDWSSDVCATDLQIQTPGSQTEVALAETIASSGINARLGTADDTARLNGLLALGPVKGVPGQTYTISAPLIGTHIDMTGCTVKWKAGVSGHNLFSNPAFTAQRTVTDGAMTVAGHPDQRDRRVHRRRRGPNRLCSWRGRRNEIGRAHV